MDKYENVHVDKLANIYFNGNVISRNIFLKDGSRKTLGVMLPGKYEFNTDATELMEIISGKLSLKLQNSQDWKLIEKGMDFSIQDRATSDSDPTPVIGPLTPKQPEVDPKPDLPPNVIGGTALAEIPQLPTVVESPFTASDARFTPVTFDAGDLNKLIEQLVGVPARPVVSAKKGGLIGMANGGLIKAIVCPDPVEVSEIQSGTNFLDLKNDSDSLIVLLSILTTKYVKLLKSGFAVFEDL